MAINTQTELFRGYGKIASLTAQTAVECRFTEEIQSIIASDVSVCVTGTEVRNGEVSYTGKAHFLLVYEDAEKHICRAERGVEFSARAEDERCAPAQTARVVVAAENVSTRREGASVYFTALVGADITLYGEESFEYLSGGDLIFKREPTAVLTAHLISGTAEAQDEFDTEFLGDILMHSERVGAADVTLSAGSVHVSGEVCLGVLALRGEAPVSFERMVPFDFEIPCDEAAAGRNAEACVRVVNVSLKAETDEEKGKCQVFASFALSAEGCVYEETEVDTVSDAFSLTHEISLAYAERDFSGAGDIIRYTERVAGKAVLSSKIDFSDTLLAVAKQHAEANLVSDGDGARIEGVAVCTLIVKGADGDVRGVEVNLPFSSSVEESDCDVDVTVCSMNARQKQEGEIDAEATLKLALITHRKTHAKYVSAAEEGDPVPENDAAISVYVPSAGDGLWELAKSLRKSPEEVAANNPELQFPVAEGQRVIIYRKKSFPV